MAHRVGIDDCHTQLLPADKLGILEQLLDKKKKNTTLAFVGDGINDAPALARATLVWRWERSVRMLPLRLPMLF